MSEDTGKINGLLNIFSKPSPLADTPAPRQRKMIDEGNYQRPDYVYLWDSCVIDSGRESELKTVCDKILINKDRYLSIEKSLGISWYFIAAIHYRETSLSFKAAFHNGDPIIGTGKLTTHVPVGRGAFDTWEESVLDACKLLRLDQIKNWDVYTCLAVAERYNGMGYRKHIGDHGVGEYSPYVWAATNMSDESGKYAADGNFDPSAPEKQVGVAAVFKYLGID